MSGCVRSNKTLLEGSVGATIGVSVTCVSGGGGDGGGGGGGEGGGGEGGEGGGGDGGEGGGEGGGIGGGLGGGGEGGGLGGGGEGGGGLGGSGFGGGDGLRETCSGSARKGITVGERETEKDITGAPFRPTFLDGVEHTVLSSKIQQVKFVSHHLWALQSHEVETLDVGCLQIDICSAAAFQVQ